MAKFLLQSSFQTGTYNNPFKRGGRGFTYSAWKTERAFATLDDEAKDAWAGFSQSGLKRRRVTLGGKTMVSSDGAVYEFRDQLDQSAAWTDAKMVKVLLFKEWMPGCRGFGL